MKLLFSLFAAAYLLLFISCDHSSRQTLPDSLILEQLLNENPDSLATILEEEINPFLLSDMERADYGWWLTNAHGKQNRNLINDTLIFYTLNYYKTTGSPRLQETYLLAAEQINSSGRHLLEKRNVLKDALEFSQAKKDSAAVREIIVRLADTYDIGENQNELKELIRLTKEYLEKEPDLHSLSLLARIYGKVQMLDSIGIYSQMGMKIAREQNLPLFDYRFSREYSNYLNFKGRNQEALQVLKDLEGRLEVGNELKLNYIMTWIGLNRMDSARVYIDSFQELLDANKHNIFEEIYLMEFLLNNMRTIIKVKQGQPISTYDWGMSPDRLLSYNRNMIKVDREQQFVQNKLLKDNFKSEIERGKLKQRSLLGGIILLIIVALMIFIYQRKLLKKERIIQQVKEQLRTRSIQLSKNESIIYKNETLIKELSGQLDENEEYRQEINLLTEENNQLNQKNKLLQKDIEQYSKSILRKDEALSVYEQLMEQNTRLQERERFLSVQIIAHTPVLDRLNKKPRYIEESQWPEVIQSINQLFDGFTYRLHTNYPALSDEDIRYCALIRLRLSTSVISILTGISPSSVTKRKQRIKEKMNQQHPDEVQKEQPLEIYLWNY